MSDQLAAPDENPHVPTQDDADSGSRPQAHRHREPLDGETTHEPSREDLQEPSTEKEPGEEPKASEPQSEPQPSHQAVGIGVIPTPQTERDETPER